ncbi:oxysterol-binding protein-related protein 11 isoform X1 [Nilaparvata lugens]|uniref:oxysterol-binding protein-related protein 11 isoform X1 n=2 Tax=Nilaparvata lugens TaxID=108931 RepID=UPI000B98BED2|nr:oxysterol-binding protein-related protein 11 isoform X1 [Nilaparvata lugens]
MKDIHVMRKKKRPKKKYCVLDHYEQQNVCNSSFSSLERMDITTEVYEGQLSKYTNVVKGWQYRWFILDPKKGILNYYLNETERRQQPRGWVHLEAAVISPSDEDSNTFTVNSTSGELFKLRAQDARARQEWVNRLRAVAEYHANAIAQKNPPLPLREHLMKCSNVTPSSLAVWDAFSAVREHLFRAEQSHVSLSKSIEELPSCGVLRNVDQELLMLKAVSQTMLLSLSQCLVTLQQQHCCHPKSKGGSEKKKHTA